MRGDVTVLAEGFAMRVRGGGKFLAMRKRKSGRECCAMVDTGIPDWWVKLSEIECTRIPGWCVKLSETQMHTDDTPAAKYYFTQCAN